MKKQHIATLTCALLLSACQAGKEINYNSVQSITRHLTTEQEIRQTFGEPVAVHTDMRNGIRTLLYRYSQNDQIKQPIAGLIGSIAGGALGYQIGDGSGQAIATMIGSAAGGAIAANSMTTREENRNLQVVISLANGRVIDYNYSEDAYRRQPWTPSTGPSPL